MILQASDFGSNFGALALGGFFAAYITALIFVGIFTYVFLAITLVKVSHRINVGPSFLAWIPFGNLYLISKIAGKHWWPILLLFGSILPVINIATTVIFGFFLTYWMWHICIRRKKQGWLALLMLIPVFGNVWYFILWGILAWDKN